MTILTGDLFAQYDLGHSICITTNGVINSRGRVVMGRGCALQAAERWPYLPKLVAEHVREHGNVPGLILPRIYTFPVKDHWAQPASLSLIRQSAVNIIGLFNATGTTSKLFIPRPGCGNGMLAWRDVRPVLEEVLSGCTWAHVISNNV